MEEYRFILVLLVVTIAYYLITGNKKIFIIASVLILTVYLYFEFYSEKYTNVEYPLKYPMKYSDMFKEQQTGEKIDDIDIKSKIFNDVGKIMWDRSKAVKEFYPFAVNSEVPNTTDFAEWVYGLKPKVSNDGNSVQIQDTCKSGSIYMNQPSKSGIHRLSCKGSW